MKTKVPPKGTHSGDTNRHSVFAALKKILRARKITYADLAERLGMSESGVKKTFAQQDCSLSRLQAIAAAGGVPIGELFDAAANAPFEQVALTRAQQEALLDEPLLLAVFWKLSVERHSTSRIARDFGLDQRALFRLLAKLDRLDLIVLEQPGDRVRLRHGELVRWLPAGPLLDHLHDVWGRELLARATRDGYLRLSQIWLRPEARLSLEADLVALLDGYARRGRTDWLSGGEAGVAPHGVLVALAAGSFVRSDKARSSRRR
ncbi:MAG: helix-turn-helix domain-containing protein [Polyangiales bacterium]